MKEKFLQFCLKEGLFESHQKVLLALSGGVDSMTLLDWLYHYRHQLGIDLVLAHVNHHQRIEADQEERGIRALAEAKHLPLKVAHFSGPFSESQARQFRYDFFEKVITPVDPTNVVIFLVTVAVAVLGTVLFRGFLSVIPILIAIVAGYLATFACGRLDFSSVVSAPLFSIPNFSVPHFKAEAIIMLLPVLLVITSEHIGHQIVTSKVIEKDLIKDPGLHRSLLGDNLSTMLSGFIGSVPTTTYGENIGVMAVTKVYSVRVIAGAAILSIVCSFMGVLTELIKTIPNPVIGGISFLLYGMIGASGIRIMVDSKVNYGKARNLTLTSIIFVTGLSGVSLNFGGIQLKGMVLACVVGMLLSLLFSIFDRLGIVNDKEEKDQID